MNIGFDKKKLFELRNEHLKKNAGISRRWGDNLFVNTLDYLTGGTRFQNCRRGEQHKLFVTVRDRLQIIAYLAFTLVYQYIVSSVIG